MLLLRSSTVIAALVALISISGPVLADDKRTLAEGGPVELVTSEIEGARLVAIRLDLPLGHGHETRRTAGSAAATGLWLRRGPTKEAPAGELERQAARAGLELRSDLGWRSVSLSLVGPGELGRLAAELMATRLTSFPVETGGSPSLLDGLWIDAEKSLQGIVGPMGNVVDTAVAAVEGGRTAFASRHAASGLSDDKIARYALEALHTRPLRLIVTGQPEAVQASVRALSTRLGERLVMAKPAQGALGRLSKPRRLEHPQTLELEQASDNLHHLAFAWTWRGLAADAGLTPTQRDAALLALRAWLGHEGSSLAQNLVDTRGLVHDLSSRLVEHDAPVFILEGRSETSNVADARHALIATLKAELGSPDEGMAWGARLAHADLRARYGDTLGRAELISDLIATGRAHDGLSSERWLDTVAQCLTPEGLSPMLPMVQGSLNDERRIIITAKPRVLPRTERMTLNGSALGRYLRVLVDLQCPGPSYPPQVATLLREKYGMTTRDYADMTRAVARDRRLMRELAQDAEYRCQELKRLRGIMSAERVVSLHEAVVCGPGWRPSEALAQKALTRIFKRFKIDASWYRPLHGMASESPATHAAMARIDARCPRGVTW